MLATGQHKLSRPEQDQNAVRVRKASGLRFQTSLVAKGERGKREEVRCGSRGLQILNAQPPTKDGVCMLPAALSRCGEETKAIRGPSFPSPAWEGR